MSLIRLEKIRCYASPLKYNFQLLNSKTKFGPSRLLPRRGFRSEISIQQEKLASLRNGLNTQTQQSSQINALCEAFNLSTVKKIALNDRAKSKWIQMEEISKAQQLYGKKSCQKCEKIRNSVKKFFRAKFETEKSNTGKDGKITTEPVSIRMHIIEENSTPTAIFETLPIDNNMTCFGCDQEKRDPLPIRGPPIVSPVCNNQSNGNITADPLGEVFKKFPERYKQITRVNRPHSLLPKKNRIVEKDQNRETSVNETQKPKSH